MKIKKHKFYIISFISLFTIFVLLHRLFGYRHIANLYATYPLSWEEIYNNFPKYFIASILLTIFMYHTIELGEKNQQKRENEAYKRIKERERKEDEKELDTENDGNDSTEI